ncbi:hydrolase CocE/NonD family protein [Colletotrichum karsti]|uniref:Hydrolase CocE/NonD family protein n=1 Tax=Colletotrichum karsti TaxID=1095194 RepID=A0A9P6I508_9PEZI|nr:hydrolase CocE/NonD family protein [Colletotrichum karsti]KAF9875930.1 hydrolase CocE/NonD family protein [Colletotrichum karsti]
MELQFAAYLCVAAFLGVSVSQDTTGDGIVQGVLRIYGNDSYPVTLRGPLPLDAKRARYPGFQQQNLTLEAGSIRREGASALQCDILFERDVPVTLRDGITIFTDVFRPATNDSVPALVAWSPYGKEIGGQWLDDLPGRSQVKLSALSELQKFEGPDPGYWVCQGYAVLNPDTRGAYSSDGNITYWGRQLGEDGYDFIEWASSQAWSSGKVALSGNSWLAVSQWFIAAENPPHLAAIAPWEGLTDLYRDVAVSGGIPAPGFQESILTTFAGKNYAEDVSRMILSEPLLSPYWQDKIATLENISVPAYVVASYTNALHTSGSFEGFGRISSPHKWLRVHNTSEWPDYYDKDNVSDLHKFFDYYLKGIDNNWTSTPRVRYAVLDPGAEDILSLEAPDWPVPGLRPLKLRLQENNSLGNDGSPVAAYTTYNGTAAGGVTFTYRVDRSFELIGHGKLRLWVSSPDADDMDLTITVQKLSRNGTSFPNNVGGESTSTIGPIGNLRVSHRELDRVRSTDYQPVLLHESELLLAPEEMVQVDIPLTPTALRFHAGELLSLTVAPVAIAPAESDLGFGTAIIPIPLHGGTFQPGQNVSMMQLGGDIESNPSFVNTQRVKTPLSRNRGMHLLHYGGELDSHLLVPIRDAKD